MTCGVTTVLRGLKVPGGTGIVTTPILTAYTSTDHIHRLLMGSTGTPSEDIIIH